MTATVIPDVAIEAAPMMDPTMIGVVKTNLFGLSRAVPFSCHRNSIVNPSKSEVRKAKSSVAFFPEFQLSPSWHLAIISSEGRYEDGSHTLLSVNRDRVHILIVLS